MAEDEKSEGGEVKFLSDRQEWYFGIDGDGMGNTVEEALEKNDLAKAQEFEKKIKSAFAEIEEWITEKGGAVIFCGGDNLLFTASGDPKEIAEHARDIYYNHTDHTLSCGVGHEPVDAHKALTIAKNTGKDKVVVWDEEQEKVYQDVKDQQEALEECESEIRDESDLEVGSSPGLKYRAAMHYNRLLGMGYEPEKAEEIVANSYRDLLKARGKRPLLGDTSAEVFLREGEEQWTSLFTQIQAEKEEVLREAEAAPVNEQKFIADKGVGLVKFVGKRFITVNWITGEMERIPVDKFRKAVIDEAYKLVPKVRVARRV